MIIYFSTVKRKRPVKEGGESVKLDWDIKRVIKTLPVFPTDPDIDTDPNPRGNSRGGKGVIISNNEIYVGTYHSVLIYDLELNYLRKITNNLFVGVHEICEYKDTLWVSSTAIDCALKTNKEGEILDSFWPRDNEILQKDFNLFPIDINREIDNRIAFLNSEMSTKKSHTHLNCVTCYQDNVFVLLNKFGLFIRIKPVFEIIINDNNLIGAHSAIINNEGNNVYICGSFSSSILIYDLNLGKLVDKIDLLQFDIVKKFAAQYPDQPFNKTIFVRGLDILDKSRVLVGISPASILEVDIKEKKLLSHYQYSTDVGDAIHGLAHINDK